MFGLLPDWVGDTLTIIAAVLGLPGIILFVLTRKQANRKLEVEEGGLTVDQFNAALPAYKDLLDRANEERKEAVDEKKDAVRRVETLTLELRETRDEVDDLEDRLVLAVELIESFVSRSEIQFTPEDHRKLARIKPSPRRFREENEGG